jgi:hypothetical protein
VWGFAHGENSTQFQIRFSKLFFHHIGIFGSNLRESMLDEVNAAAFAARMSSFGPFKGKVNVLVLLRSSPFSDNDCKGLD